MDAPPREPLRTAPDGVKEMMRGELTQGGSLKLVDVSVSAYSSLAAVFWDEKTNSWTKEPHVNVRINANGAPEASMKISYAYVSVRTPSAVRSAGYELAGVLFFTEETVKRLGGLFAAAQRHFEGQLALWFRSMGAKSCAQASETLYDVDLRDDSVIFDSDHMRVSTGETTLTCDGTEVIIRRALPCVDP